MMGPSTEAIMRKSSMLARQDSRQLPQGQKLASHEIHGIDRRCPDKVCILSKTPLCQDQIFNCCAVLKLVHIYKEIY